MIGLTSLITQFACMNGLHELSSFNKFCEFWKLYTHSCNYLQET